MNYAVFEITLSAEEQLYIWDKFSRIDSGKI
jgi:hypothetical protein